MGRFLTKLGNLPQIAPITLMRAVLFHHKEAKKIYELLLDVLRGQRKQRKFRLLKTLFNASTSRGEKSLCCLIQVGHTQHVKKIFASLW
jgi:hypothetical protein